MLNKFEITSVFLLVVEFKQTKVTMFLVNKIFKVCSICKYVCIIFKTVLLYLPYDVFYHNCIVLFCLKFMFYQILVLFL